MGQDMAELLTQVLYMGITLGNNYVTNAKFVKVKTDLAVH